MGYASSRAGQAEAGKPSLNDRANYQFARLLPEGNTSAQKSMPPAGPYHVNHFICYFTIRGQSFTEVQGRQAAGLLTFGFLKNFPVIFSERNIARAQGGWRGVDDFDGSKTVEFAIGSNVGTLEHRVMGLLHQDWVAMSGSPSVTIDDIDGDSAKELRSFHGDTLKRLWDSEVEKGIMASMAKEKPSSTLQDLIVALLPPPLPTLLKIGDFLRNPQTLSKLLEFNRLHFLAGTRSWRIGYDGAHAQFFVETIAIERFSCRLYQVAEALHSTRKDILDLWDNLLNNFVKTRVLSPRRFTAVEPPAALSKQYGYKTSGLFPYIRNNAWEFQDLAALTEEFQAAKLIPPMKTLKQSHAGLYAHLKG